MEVALELLFNVRWLRALREKTPKSAKEAINEENVRLFVPERALTSACRYAVESGEIRLLSDYSKQEAIRNSLEACEIFNATAEKTDLMVCLFLLKPDGIESAIHRVESVAESATQLANFLKENATKLVGPRLVSELLGEQPQEAIMVEEKRGESQDKLLQKIEQGFKDMQEQLQKSDKANRSLFVFGFGFAVLAAGLAVALAFHSIKDQFGIIPLSVLIAMLIIGGYVIIGRSGGMAILDTTFGESQAKLGRKRDKVVLILCSIAPAIVYVGIAIKQWFAMPGNSVAIFGLFVFIVGIIMFNCKKSPNASAAKTIQKDSCPSKEGNVSLKAKHTAKWDAKTWTIFGVLVALLAPLMFFYIFEVLDYHFGYQCLMWVGFVLVVGSSLRSYLFIKLLRWIGNIAYGEHTFTA
jgi:hypothetical protein